MSDNEIDQELLALADDDSGSEADAAQPTSRQTKSPSPPRSPPASSQKPKTPSAATPTPPRPPKGVAQRKTMKSSRATGAKRRRKDDSEEEGQASSAPPSPNSLGSGAMSESESEGGDEDIAADIDEGVMFPVDGIFRSEKEKADIHSMPEIERERLLAERAEEAEKLAQSARLRQLMQAREKAAASVKKRKAGTADLEESPRKSSRAKVKQSENLEAYKRQREQRNEQRRRGNERRALEKKSLSPEASSDAEGDAESDVEWDEGTTKAAQPRDEPPPQLRDFQRVQVGRTNFAKVCFYPGFDDAIRGCFCRVAIGMNRATNQNTYRMTQIKGFTKGKPYMMEGSNGRPFHTDQYAILSHGKAEKEWPFIACSDSKLTEAEYERYMHTISTEGLRVPTLSFLSGKCTDIQQLLDRRWTDEEISEKLRRAGVIQSQSASRDKERLLNERKQAVEDGNEADIARIDQELTAIEGPKLQNSNGNAKPTIAKAPTQQERLAAINRANRKANVEEIRKAQLEEKRRAERLNSALARGEGVANPFARVKTRAKVHHDANGNETLQVPHKQVDDLFGEVSDISRASTPGLSAANGAVPKSASQKPVAAGAKKKVTDDDVLGAMDLGIDIEI